LGRHLYSLLLLSLLLTTISIVSAGSIGPGIDTSEGTQITFGYEAYAMYDPGDIYIEFTAPASDTYSFYIGWGTAEESGGYIQFVLTDGDNNYIKDVAIAVDGHVTFHTEYLFDAHLTAGQTYRLWIKMDNLIGTLMLWAYDKDKDPSVTMYNHPQYGWFEIADIAWYAEYSSTSTPNNIPQARILDVWADGNGVHVRIKIWNWKNGTEIAVGRYDHINNIVMSIQTFYVSSTPTQEIIATFDRINEGDKIYISGYDLNGNYYSAYISRINATYVKPSWLDIVKQWFDALIAYSGLAFATVQAIIPYAGAFYFLTLLGSFFQCLRTLSLTPLFDFFYKQYSTLVSLASLAIKIAEKMYEGLKILGQFLVSLISTL